MKNFCQIVPTLVVAAIMIASGATASSFGQEQSVPPPSAPAQLSEADLEKLVAPIALYPDSLLAVILPASVYPLEVVQAARFIQNTNNLPQLEDQPWDENVKAAAAFPPIIEKMNDDLQWTIQLGNAFLDQQMELMNAIQTLRTKAMSVGTLRTTEQQIVIVTNAVVERYFEEKIVYVTNTVVEIQPADPQIVYVPQYNPVVIYSPVPVYYSYYPPVRVTFFVSYRRCDWYYGGVYTGRGGIVIWGGRGPYHPPYYPPPPGCRPPYYRPPPGHHPPPPSHRPPGYPPSGSRPPENNQPGGSPGSPAQRPSGPAQLPAANTMERWQPDQNRLRNAGAPSSGSTREARGWSSSGPSVSARPALGGNAGAGNIAGNRPSTGTVPARPNTGAVGNRPATGAIPNQPNTGSVANRPATGSVPGRPNTGAVSNRPNPGTMPANNSPAMGNRPAQSGGSSGSAFSGVSNGSAARNYSDRGAASRGSANRGGRR